MRRLELLDGLRGYFLVFMLLNHMYFTGGLGLVHFNHAEIGFVEDAQGFVFMSGLLIGMVYAKRMAREGFAAGAMRIWHRAAQLYLYALSCLFLIFIAARVMPIMQQYWTNWLGDFATPGSSATVAAAVLLYQPTYMDILPQYIVYLLVAPPLVYLVLTGRWTLVAIGSALCWLAVQLGVHLPASIGLNSLLSYWSPNLTVRAYFNVFAWQVVFMSGLVLGAMTSTGKIDWSRVFRPEQRTMLVTAITFFLFFMALRMSWTFSLVPDVTWDRFVAVTNRGEFSFVYLLNFLATGYLLAWVMIAGPRASENWIRRLASMLNGLFRWSFLRLLGRNSLQVYVFHVFIVYALLAIDQRFGPFNEVTRTLIAIGAIVSLSIPAWLHEVDLREGFRTMLQRSRFIQTS